MDNLASWFWEAITSLKSKTKMYLLTRHRVICSDAHTTL